MVRNFINSDLLYVHARCISDTLSLWCELLGVGWEGKESQGGVPGCYGRIQQKQRLWQWGWLAKIKGKGFKGLKSLSKEEGKGEQLWTALIFLRVRPFPNQEGLKMEIFFIIWQGLIKDLFNIVSRCANFCWKIVYILNDVFTEEKIATPKFVWQPDKTLHNSPTKDF